MADFEMIDALTGDTIIQNEATGDFSMIKGEAIPTCTSIFFPGCSMINYAMPLTIAIYDTLKQHGVVDGMSLLCCGKILKYETNGVEIRAAFEDELKERISETTIKKIVCACPNCVKALRDAFKDDSRVDQVEIAVLPQVFVDLGYRLDESTVAELIKGDPEDDVLLCPHDSCPDRDYGQFADALREIMPDGMWADPEHCRRTSICCGSLPRAAGKIDAANKCASTCGQDSVNVGADSIVTACMSCTFQLNMAQPLIPAVHFLELLYNWRINWAQVGAWMKVRFLFNDTLGVIESEDSSRKFEGLGSSIDDALDPIKDEDVSISNDNVADVGM